MPQRRGTIAASRSESGGEASKRRLQQLIQGGYTEIERTGRNCRWGRECINLYVDGVNACDVLISEGYAAPLNRSSRIRWCH
jgi:endonuclease YncB( thermonuclease family)